MILRFGTPEVFLSDNGTEFKNRALAEYLKALGIHHLVTPPYHPQASPVESVNQTLKTRLIAYVKENHASWDENLPELVFSLKSLLIVALDSPAMFNYGRQPLPPGTAKRARDRVVEVRASQEKVGEWTTRMKGLDQLNRAVNYNIDGEQERQAR